MQGENTGLDTHSEVSKTGYRRLCLRLAKARARQWCETATRQDFQKQRHILDQCRVKRLCGHVSSVVGRGNPPNAPGRRSARAARLVPCTTRNVPVWQCHSCKASSSNTRNQYFGCGACKGQQLVREHVTAQPETGSNMGRAQAPPTPPAHAGTEAEEPVRGKKALKKHLQRSIDKLVAAKEQLPEEEEREVAQGIAERIKALHFQKDALISVTARRKKKPLHNSRSRRRRPNQAESSAAGAGGVGGGAAETCCGARGMCERGAGNRRRGRRRRRVCARRGPGQGKGSLPGMVQPVCSFFTVGRSQPFLHFR